MAAQGWRWIYQIDVASRFVLGVCWTLWMSMWACVSIALFGPERGWLLACQNWGRGLLRLVRVDVDVEGAEHLQGPAVYIANHTSLMDAVFLPTILPRTIRFVVKSELVRIPFFGWALGAAAVVVDRTRPDQAVQAMQRALVALPRGWSVVIFPEGTRPPANHPGMLPFKKGAFHLAMASGLPLVPIGVAGTDKISPNGAFLVHPGKLYVSAGAPISAQDWQRDTLDGHIADVRQTVENLYEASQARSVQAQNSRNEVFEGNRGACDAR